MTTAPVRYPASMMAEARELAEAGFYPVGIRRILQGRHGTVPSLVTIRAWVDPGYAERQNAKCRRRNARLSAERAKFRLRGDTPEFRAQFMRRLRDEGMPHESIARCCRVVFDDPSINWRVVKVALEATA